MANPIAEDERKVYEPLDIIRAKILGREEQELEKQTRQRFVNWTPIRSGIIPMGSHCKQIRDDEGSWNQMESYIHAHSEAVFSHGICPSCMQEHDPKGYAAISKMRKKK